MKNIILTFVAVLTLGLFAGPVDAQTVLNSTTLSAAVADGNTRAINLTSATGVTAPGNGTNIQQVVLVIDREVMTVTGVSGTLVSVSRGEGTRAVPHVNGSIVWIAPRQFVYTTLPSGQCVRTSVQAVPYIVGATVALGSENGATFDCLGVTTAGQWVQTNGSQAGLPVLGATIASPNGVLSLSGTIFKVSGTNAITGFTLPAGAAPGFMFSINPTGIFTWTAAGNISLAGSAVVGKLLTFTWDGSKFVPSYIA